MRAAEQTPVRISTAQPFHPNPLPQPHLAAVREAPSLHGRRYSNPVIRTDAPDPGVIRVGNKYVLVHTGADKQGAFPMYQSTDLVHWHRTGSLFKPGHQPRWARGDFWAPEIHAVGKGYVAYFTARDASGALRIGCARAPTAEGPFKDIGHPLAVNHHVGLIDPTFVKDPSTGKQYLYWKEDWNGHKPPLPTHIVGQEVSADGTRLLGKGPKRLLTNDAHWEGPIVEAPEIIKHGEYFYLFYSGNGYWGSHYAEGVARSKSPLGPFTKKSEPILRSGPQGFQGPGHGSVFTDAAGHTFFAYAAWKDAQHMAGNNPREVLIDTIHWHDGWPHIGRGVPSRTGQLP